MSGSIPVSSSIESPPALAVPSRAARSESPGARAWRRFKRNRLGFWSLAVFCTLVVLSLFADVLSNDRPLLVRFNGEFYFPMVRDYPETTFGGDFATTADYLDPYVRQKITAGDNWALYPPNPYGPNTLNYFATEPFPAPPGFANLLGTDERGRDLLAQLIYGFRINVLFGLALTVIGVLIGVLTGAIQGFFGGKTDLAFQRFIEIWGSMPELYLLIIFSAVFAPSVALLVVLLSLFGWMGLSDYVRAEFLRNRQMDYVRGGASARGRQRPHHVEAHPSQQHDARGHLPAVPDECGHPGAHVARFPRAGRAAGNPFPGRVAEPGKDQPGRLVDFALHFCRAGHHAVAADLHGRRPARCAGSAKGGQMNAPLLQVEGLRVAFSGKEVVHGVDFHIAPGEKLALVGESGSGKTVTALSLLGLVQNADVSGSARFAVDGGAPARDLLTMTERELLAVRGQQIAMIFQEPMTALNPLYTVGDQIAEVLQLKEGLTGREAWEAAIAALAACGLPEPERRALAYPHQLSGGQRQRAMIAMSLSGRPKLLLADEPTTALDVTLRGQILDLLSEVQHQNGMAILLITHDLNLVRKFADRVAVMENGHLVEQGPVAQVFSNPRHPYTRKLIDSRPVRDVTEGALGTPGAGDAGHGFGGELSDSPSRHSRLVPQGQVRRRRRGRVFDRAGPHPGSGGRVRIGQVHLGAGRPGADAVPRRARSGRPPLGSGCVGQQVDPSRRCRSCSRTRIRRCRRA